MMSGQDAWTVVFGIPKLLGAILSFLDLKSLCAVRLVDRHFFRQCDHYFSLLLDVKDEHRRPFLQHLIDMAHHGLEPKGSWDRIKRLHLRRDICVTRKIPNFHCLATVLNCCHNLEKIHLKDTPGNMGHATKKSAYPARIS